MIIIQGQFLEELLELMLLLHQRLSNQGSKSALAHLVKDFVSRHQGQTEKVSVKEELSLIKAKAEVQDNHGEILKQGKRTEKVEQLEEQELE